MGDVASQVGDGVGQIGKIESFMALWGLFPSSLIKKIGKPNLVIKVVFLVLWGSEGEQLGDRWVIRNLRSVTG